MREAGTQQHTCRHGLNVRFSVHQHDLSQVSFEVAPELRSPLLRTSSVTDPGWLDEIPVDRPTLMVAEGVLPYLTAAEVRQLLVRLTDRLPSGELIFDGVAGPTARMSKLFQWSLGDPREIQGWNPRLTLLDVVPVVADFEQISYRGYRALFQLLNKIQAMRNGLRLLRYRF
jgi:hypothetical protein